MRKILKTRPKPYRRARIDIGDGKEYMIPHEVARYVADLHQIAISLYTRVSRRYVVNPFDFEIPKIEYHVEEKEVRG